MEKVSSKYADQAVVNVYDGDEIVERVTRDIAKVMKSTGAYFFFHHGKDLKKITVCELVTSVIEKEIGWNMPRMLQASGLNRGSASHTGKGLKARWNQVPSYPIPPVFKGHLIEPKAAVVNFVPDTCLT